MARWENVLMEHSRLLLDFPKTAARCGLTPTDEFMSDASDDEGRDYRIAVHSRWHFPRALRWWTHRGSPIDLAS
jgi:hypothetical protein